MKTKGIFAIAMIFLSLTGASAQSNIIFGGFNFPNGKFKGDDYTKVVVLDQGKEGGAGMGFNLGYKFLSPISNQFNWFLSAELFYNGLNSEIKDDVEDLADKSGMDINKFPSYLNAPVIGGLNYSFANLNPDLSLWAEVGAGLNFRFLTDYAYERGENETTLSYNTNFLFAYQLGVGVMVKNKFTIGIHYYDLGSEKLKGKYKEEDDSGKEKDDFKSSKPLDTSMLSIRVGFIF